jgi:hypothetical protein
MSALWFQMQALFQGEVHQHGSEDNNCTKVPKINIILEHIYIAIVKLARWDFET